MFEQPAPEIENSFLSRARYPKGKKRLQAILDATYDIVISEGLAAASQMAIAKRAGVTESAVRYYFPTKDDLLVAFFSSGIEHLQQLLHTRMVAIDQDPRAQLLDSASLHYDRIFDMTDVYFFEAAAFWGRNPKLRKKRDEWDQSLVLHYVRLLERIHPEWDKQQWTETSFNVLTLILGGWVTMGSSRVFLKHHSREELKSMLLRSIKQLIG